MGNEQPAGGEKHKKQSKQNKKMSLSTRLHFGFMGIVMILVISFLLSIYSISKQERDAFEERDAESHLNSISTNIKSSIDHYSDFSKLIIRQDKVRNFLLHDINTIDNGKKYDARASMRNIVADTEGVDSVIVIRLDEDIKVGADEEGGAVIEVEEPNPYADRMKNNEDEIKKAADRKNRSLSTKTEGYDCDEAIWDTEEWRNPIIERRGGVSYSINANYTIRKKDGHPLFTIARLINDPVTLKPSVGILLMNISDSVMNQAARSVKDGKVCVIGTDGTFFAGDQSLMKYYDSAFKSSRVIHTKLDEETDQILVSGCQVDSLPLVLIHVTNLTAKSVPLGNGSVLIFLLIICMFVIIAAGVFITKNITGPVFAMIGEIEKNKESGTLEKVDLQLPNNELFLLQETYNNMIEHVNELITRLLENEKAIQKAEMRVLHEQIKPHFLYNSLETIGYLAVDAGAEDVHSALETLGSFYRNFLSKGDREIPLYKEVMIVQDYLALQKLRYGDIIDDEYDIADDTKDCIVPKLILQPLVENSIYHGIRLKGERGTIRISSRAYDGELHLTIMDTGVGMSPEQIEKMMRKEQVTDTQETGEQSESFGLWGTIERIRCFCDDDDVVKIRSEVGEYTEIEFIIPLKKMEKVSENNVQSNDH